MNDDLKSWDEGSASYLATTSDIADPYKKFIDTPSFISLLGNIDGKTILDIGCGDGYFCAELAKHGAQVTGLDGSENMLSVARKRYPEIKFLHGDLMTQEIELGERADIATSKMMLMNVASVKKVAEKVKAVLKDNGIFAVDIVHPFRPILKNAVNNVSNYQSGFNYFQQTKGSIKFSGKDFAYYYRPLNIYLNEILSAGFCLKMIEEPAVSEEFLKRFPDLLDKYKYPISLHLLFTC